LQAIHFEEKTKSSIYIQKIILIYLFQDECWVKGFLIVFNLTINTHFNNYS